MFTFEGRIVYKEPSGWVVVNAPNSIALYYRKVVEWLTWDKLQHPLYNFHVTVINGNFDHVVGHKNWKKYHNKKITLKYDGRIQKGKDGYYWLNIYDDSNLLRDIRLGMGLTPYPPYPFHATIGHSHRIQQIYRQNNAKQL